MRRLDPVLGGAAPEPHIMAVKACVISVTTFGAKVWCPGLKRPSTRGIL